MQAANNQAIPARGFTEQVQVTFTVGKRSILQFGQLTLKAVNQAGSQGRGLGRLLKQCIQVDDQGFIHASFSALSSII